jgi:hypothetical protein
LLFRIIDKNNAEQAGLFQQARTSLVEPVGVSVDLASVTRNTRSIFNAAAPLVTSLGFLGGLLLMISGLFMISTEYETMMKCRKIGDTEGEKQAFLKLEAGIGMVTVGLGMVVSKMGVVLDAAKLSSVAGNAIINPGSVLMYLFFLMRGICEAKVASAFCSDLNEQLKNGTDAGIQFLHNQIFLTEAEIEGLKKKNKELNGSDSDLKEALEKAKNNLQKTKLAEFERCTDKKTLDDVIDFFKDHLIPNNEEDEKALVSREEIVLEHTADDKVELIDKVKKANFARILKASLLIFIAVAGLAAVVAGIVLTGPLPFIMCAVIAGLWLLFDKQGAADKLADVLWRFFLEEQKVKAVAMNCLPSIASSPA